MTTENLEQESAGTEVAVLNQDASTVDILKDDDLKEVKDTMKKVTQFKRNYTPKKLAVTDIDSKKQKEDLRLAIKDIRDTRTGLEKVRKEKIKPYQETIAFINGNYNKAIEVLESLETPLKDIKAVYEAKIELRERQAEIDLQNKVNDRIDRMLKAGATFNDGYYQVGSEEFGVENISLGMVNFQSMTDDIFEIVLDKVSEGVAIINEKQAEKEAALKIAAERKAAEEKAEREVFEAAQAALKAEKENFEAEQAAFRKQQEEMKVAQEALAEQQRQVQLQKEKEERKKAEAFFNSRIDILLGIGMKENVSGNWEYDDLWISKEAIVVSNEKDFGDAVSALSVAINDRESVKAKVALEKCIAEDKESEAKRKAEEERIAAKAIEDKRIADELAEKQRLEALAAAKDDVKYTDVLDQLWAVKFPEMATKKYQAKIQIIKDFISDLK